MQITFVLFLLILSRQVFCDSDDDDDPTTPRPRRTFGVTYGQNVTIQSYPCYCRLWILRVDGYTYFCGGTLIASNQIVTAAHCMVGTEQIYACCGSASCLTQSGTCYYSATAAGVFIHPGFLQATLVGAMFDDIAYIRVNGSFLSPNTKPCGFCSMSSTALETAPSTLQVVGCGVTQTGKVD